jgi:hypothetical protein
MYRRDKYNCTDKRYAGADPRIAARRHKTTITSKVKEWVGMGQGWGYWHPRPSDLVGDGLGPILVE